MHYGPIVQDLILIITTKNQAIQFIQQEATPQQKLVVAVALLQDVILQPDKGL